jgi:hypothetical protein
MAVIFRGSVELLRPLAQPNEMERSAQRPASPWRRPGIGAGEVLRRLTARARAQAQADIAIAVIAAREATAYARTVEAMATAKHADMAPVALAATRAAAAAEAAATAWLRAAAAAKSAAMTWA